MTHDTEEAAKLGDRIAVLSRGGALEQYDTSAEILGCPATPFVADFVGADRGVRRLADDWRYLGVLTPNRLHAEMRRSVGGTPVEP